MKKAKHVEEKISRSLLCGTVVYPDARGDAGGNAKLLNCRTRNACRRIDSWHLARSKEIVIE